MSVDKDVPVLRISYKSPDPVKAAHVTNALAAAYIADYIDEKYKSADTTSVFLNRELKTYSGKLAASESAIEQYRDNNNIVNIRQETETDLRKISDLKKQLVSVQMNLVAMDSLNRYIKRGESSFDDLAPNFEAFTDLLSTEMIKKTKELQSEKRDLLMKYTPEHEKLKVLDAKIDDIKKYLIESIKNTENHLRVKYNNLQNTIADEEKKFIGLPTKEKTMTIMERDFGLNEQIYRFLHEKRTEAEIAKAAKISFHRVISEAEIPKKPVSPNATIIIVFSGFLGFLGGTAFVYFVSFIKGRVSNQETIYKNSATPIAALIPHASKKNKMTVAFNKWAIELDLKGLLSNGTVISFSSFAKAEGKSFISNELVKAIRLRDKKVLVVDVDGAMQVNTLTNYINLEKVPEKWQSLSVWHTMVNSWKENYDVIIIKNTPINDYPIVMQVMSSAVLNLIVLDSRKTKKVAIQNADLLKEDLSLYNMQFVLNRNGYTPTIYTYAVEFFKKLVKLRK
jgi:LPS O-antigen subunit length determinant protein (WzzB/FepE family)